MGAVISIIQSNKLIAIFLAALLVFLVLRLIAGSVRKKKDRARIQQLSMDKRRDDSLNKVILNEKAPQDARSAGMLPYEVDYDSSLQASRKDIPQGTRILSVIETGDLSRRKYVLNLDRPVYIGSSEKNNDIVLSGSFPSEVRCEIFSTGEKVFIRNTGTFSEPMIQRKKEKALIDRNGLRLKNSDILVLGGYTYEITID